MSTDKNPTPKSEGSEMRTSLGRVIVFSRSRSGVKTSAPPRPTTKPPERTPPKQEVPKQDVPQEEPPKQEPPKDVPETLPTENPAFVEASSRMRKEVSELRRRLFQAIGESGIDAPELSETLDGIDSAIGEAGGIDDLLSCGVSIEKATQSVDEFARSSSSDAKFRKAFETALGEARKALGDAQKLPAAGICEAVSAPARRIEEAIGRAVVHAEAGTGKSWTEAVDLLGDPVAELRLATEASEKAGPARATLSEAEEIAGEMSRFRFVDLSAVTGPLEEGRTGLANAADVNEIEAAHLKLTTALEAAKEAKSRAEVTIQAWNVADRRLRQAEQAIVSCQGLVGYGPVTGPGGELLVVINQARRDLDAAATHGAVVDVARRVDPLPDRTNEIRVLAPDAAKALMKLSAARQKVGKVAALGYVDTSAAMRVVEDAERGVAEASDAGAAKLAMAPLDGIGDLLDKAMKKAAPAGKERDNWLDARRTATDIVSKARSRPGASAGSGVAADERIVRVIGQMERILGEADTEATAGTVEGYRAARKLVEPFGKFGEFVKGFSEEVTKDLKEDFAAQKDFKREMLRLERAVMQLAELPGQEMARVAIGVLRKAARDSLQNVGGLTRGYAAAVKLLTDPVNGHAAILANAKKDEQERTKDAKYDDEVLGLHRAVLTVALRVGETKELVPEVVYRGWRAELREALESALITKDVTEERLPKIRELASARLREVQVAIERAELDLEPVAKEVRQRIEAAENWYVNPIRDRATTTFVESALGEIRRIREVEIAGFAWEAARDRLEALRILTKEHAADLRDAVKDWGTVLIGIDRCLEQSGPLVEGWPERAGALVHIRPELAAVRDETPKTREWDKGVDRGRELITQHDEAWKLVEKASGGQDPKAIAAAAAKVRSEALRLVAEAEGRVRDFSEKHLAGIRNVAKIPPIAAVNGVVRRWNDFVREPKIPQGRNPDEVFQEEFEKLKRDLSLAVSVLERAEKSRFDLPKVIKAGRDADEQEHEANRKQIVDDKLRLYESRGGDAGPFRHQVSDGGDLKQIERILDAQIERIATVLTERAEKGKKDATDLALAVRREQGTEQTHKEFYEAVVSQTEDLKSLLGSGDPDLVRQAEEELAALKQKFEVSVKPPEGMPGLDKVAEAWERIAKDLGGNVLKRMPDTWRRLSDRAIEATSKSRTMAPADALVYLEPLLLEAAKAREEGDRLAARYEQFGELREQVSKSLEELIGSTATTLGKFGKVEAGALEKRISTELKLAKELAKTEGSMDQAFVALSRLQGEIDGLRNSPDPRKAIGEANAKAKQQQADVIAYCRKYEGLRKEFKHFRDQARVIQAIHKTDESYMTELERTLEFADKLVSQYMALRSKSPAKRKGANPSPPMDRVIQAFTTASERLQKGITGARRYIRNPKGTTVEVTGDVEAAEARWRKAAQAFGVHVKSLADRIDTSVREDTTNGPRVEADVKTLLPRMRRISTKFAPQAFAASVSTLANAPDATQAKAAREVVLRDVRRISASFVKDPLIQAISRKPNPFGVAVHILASELRAALKSVEREALIGV